MTYRIQTRVKNLEQKKITTSSKKDPNSDKILSTVAFLGWFVLFEGSYESLFVGHDEPKDLTPGTEVDIIIKPKTEK
jgi:hypothetical protein